MPVFIASLHNELFKLRKRKKYTVLLIIAGAVCVLSGLRGIVVNAISGMDFDRAALLGGLTLSHMTFFLQIFLPLMAIMAACDLFPVEFHDRTIRACLMRPVGRGKLYFSKVAAVFVLCVFDLAVLFAVTAVTQLVLGGTAEGIGTGLAACVLDLVPLAVLICFLCCLDQLLHGRRGDALHRLPQVAQPLDRHGAAALRHAPADRAAGGLRAGLRLLRLSALRAEGVLTAPDR